MSANRKDVRVLFSLAIDAIGKKQERGYFQRIRAWVLSKPEKDALYRRAKIGALTDRDLDAIGDYKQKEHFELFIMNSEGLGILKKCKNENEYELFEENYSNGEMTEKDVAVALNNLEQAGLIKRENPNTDQQKVWFTFKGYQRAYYWLGVEDLNFEEKLMAEIRRAGLSERENKDIFRELEKAQSAGEIDILSFFEKKHLNNFRRKIKTLNDLGMLQETSND